MHQIAIGELLKISERVRDALTKTDARKKIIHAAIDGDERYFFVFQSWKQDINGDDIEMPALWTTQYSVSAVAARDGKKIALPEHITEREGFAAIICLASYLRRLKAHEDEPYEDEKSYEE